MKLPDGDDFHAAFELVGRTGAKNVEIGYERDDVPVEEAGWYARADFGPDGQVRVEGAGPTEALEGLAAELLEGALCRRCSRPIIVLGDGDGCQWERVGRRWEPGCDGEIDQSMLYYRDSRGVPRPLGGGLRG